MTHPRTSGAWPAWPLSWQLATTCSSRIRATPIHVTRTTLRMWLNSWEPYQKILHWVANSRGISSTNEVYSLHCIDNLIKTCWVFCLPGELLHIENLKPWDLYSVLTQKYSWSSTDARDFSNFLTPMLAYNTARRATALDCLNHEWIRNERVVEPRRKKSSSVNSSSSTNSDSKYSNSSSSPVEKIKSPKSHYTENNSYNDADRGELYYEKPRDSQRGSTKEESHRKKTTRNQH